MFGLSYGEFLIICLVLGAPIVVSSMVVGVVFLVSRKNAARIDPRMTHCPHCGKLLDGGA